MLASVATFQEGPKEQPSEGRDPEMKDPEGEIRKKEDNRCAEATQKKVKRSGTTASGCCKPVDPLERGAEGCQVAATRVECGGMATPGDTHEP